MFRFVCVATLLHHCIYATTYFVDPSLSASGSGTSWSTAFITFDEALSAAASTADAIWLKGGHTYIPQNPADRSDCFKPSTGVEIYGGFTGTESSIFQRGTSLQSILSGDIGVVGDATDNCYHVVQYTSSLLLDGVVIEHGYADYDTSDYLNTDNVLHRYGGALITTTLIGSQSVSLNNVVVRNNTALNGGAIWMLSNTVNDVRLVIRDSLFEHNRAVDGVYEGGYGGSIYEMFLANVTLINTQFIENYAEYRGGAIYQDYGSVLQVEGCTFRANAVNGFGGAIFSEDRNSQTTDGTQPVVRDSIFESNTAAAHGGAICWFNAVEGTLSNNEFSSNTAGVYGGGVALLASTATSSGNTFTSNVANGDSTSNDEYNEAELAFTGVDETLTFDVTAELAELYATWTSMQTETDLYPFNSADALCFVDGSNSNYVQDGTSWSTAYSDIQPCLDDLSSNGGEVWVTAGTYAPTVIPEWKERVGKTNPVHVSFVMYDDIRMYGGFSGSETSRSQRNWRDNPTFLSCQLARTQCTQIVNSADNTLLDGFVFIDAGGSSTRRRLQTGGANSISVDIVLRSTSHTVGGGIYSNSTTVSVANSIFHKLFAQGKGGAVYCIGMEGSGELKSPTFINVAFLGNRAVARGGAISADAYCHFTCTHCKFVSNECAKKGGAIYLDFDCDPTLTHVTFSENNALESGGCIAADGQSLVTFEGDAQFTSNSALMEGACLYSGSGVSAGKLQGFIFNQVPTFVDNAMTYAGSGHADIYGWPWSTFDVGAPTSPPTPAPIYVAPPDHSGPPNILVITIDDILMTTHWNLSIPRGTQLQGKTVSYFDVDTPNIDAFISESVWFPTAFSASPKCAPSRFAIITGRNAGRSEYSREVTLQTTNGQYGVNVSIIQSKLGYNDSYRNAPYILQHDANTPYYTGMIGKWHLINGNDWGHQYGCSNTDRTVDAVAWEQCRNLLHEQGFDYVDAFYNGNIEESVTQYSHNPEWMLSKTQRFIANATATQRPFLLYLSTTLTHNPDITIALRDFTYLSSPRGTLTGDEVPDDTLMSDRASILAKTLELEPVNPIKQKQVAGILWTDDMMGALFTFMRNAGVYDNTLIVLQNDHNFVSKGLLYQLGSRILHWVRYPPLFGDNGPYVMPEDFVVSSVDLAAVIFEVSGVTPPSDYITDGRSWVSDVVQQIQNPETATPTCCDYRFMDMYNSRSISNNRYQYIWRLNPNLVETDNNFDSYYAHTYEQEQFYDLLTDPNQQTNSILDSQYAEQITLFQSMMRDYIIDTCPMPDPTQCIMPVFTFGTMSPTTPTDAPTTPSPTTPSPTTPSPTTPSPTTPSPGTEPVSTGTPITSEPARRTRRPTNDPTADPTSQPTEDLATATMDPTAAPTDIASDYTCASTVDWYQEWTRVRVDPGEPYFTYKSSAEEEFLVQHPHCGSETRLLEYWYSFTFTDAEDIDNRILSMNMTVCCDGTFGATFVPCCDMAASRRVINLYYGARTTKRDSWSDPSQFGWKQYLVFTLSGVCGAALLVAAAVICYRLYQRRQQKKAFQRSESHLTPLPGATSAAYRLETAFKDVEMTSKSPKSPKNAFSFGSRKKPQHLPPVPSMFEAVGQISASADSEEARTDTLRQPPLFSANTLPAPNMDAQMSMDEDVQEQVAELDTTALQGAFEKQ